MKKTLSYTHTIYASYIGYINQTIVNNFAPLLFLTFASEFSLTLDRITLLVTVCLLKRLRYIQGLPPAR